MTFWEEFLRTGPLPEVLLKHAMLHRNTLDRMEKLTVQLAWLRETVFTGVDLLYKNHMLAVMRGRKEDQ